MVSHDKLINGLNDSDLPRDLMSHPIEKNVNKCSSPCPVITKAVTQLPHFLTV